MKTLVSVLTAAALLAGVGAASARDQQETGVEIDYALSHKMASPGAYASDRIPGRVTGQQDFQAQGSH